MCLQKICHGTFPYPRVKTSDLYPNLYFLLLHELKKLLHELNKTPGNSEVGIVSPDKPGKNRAL